jgi:hypothetical protein
MKQYSALQQPSDLLPLSLVSRIQTMAPSLLDSNRSAIESFIDHQTTESVCSSDGFIGLELGHYWASTKETKVSVAPIRESTFLKAAWILTLRCFHPEEVMSLSYVEESIPRSNPPVAFTVRVNPDWDVSSLLKALEMKEFGTVTSSPQSYGARLSDLPQSRHVCNSALRYVTIPDRLFTPSTLLDETLEVSGSLRCIGFHNLIPCHHSPSSLLLSKAMTG